MTVKKNMLKLMEKPEKFSILTFSVWLPRELVCSMGHEIKADSEAKEREHRSTRTSGGKGGGGACHFLYSWLFCPA